MNQHVSFVQPKMELFCQFHELGQLSMVTVLFLLQLQPYRMYCQTMLVYLPQRQSFTKGWRPIFLDNILCEIIFCLWYILI